MGVAAGEATNLRVHVRGSHLTLGPEVPRGLPHALAGDAAALDDPARGGRLELARWLVHPEHPLTARVFVNRVWRWHFGRGLVATPDNFGARGEAPSHRELLDWLARRFIAGGWSLKSLQRLILLSSTYRMSSAREPEAARLDPENRLLWRWSPRRLEAEAVRDSILAVAGDLDLAMGGTLLTHVRNREFLFDHTSKDATRYETSRRSVYLPVIRNHVHDVFQLFDFPDPAVPNGDRPTTTVAPQALFLLNGDLVTRAAARLAARLSRAGEDDAARVRLLYQIVCARFPTGAESARALAFLESSSAALAAEGEEEGGARRLRAWQALCQVVLAGSELIIIE
jgi:hypothetical protein